MKSLFIALSLGILPLFPSCDAGKASIIVAEPDPTAEKPVQLFGITFDAPAGWYHFPKLDSITSIPGGQTHLALTPVKSFKPRLPEFAMITVETKRVDESATAPQLMAALSAICNRGGVKATEPKEVEINSLKFWAIASLMPDQPFPGASWKTETLGTIVEEDGRRIFYAFFFNYEVMPDNQPATDARYCEAMQKAMKSLRPN